MKIETAYSAHDQQRIDEIDAAIAEYEQSLRERVLQDEKASTSGALEKFDTAFDSYINDPWRIQLQMIKREIIVSMFPSYSVAEEEG
jgi:hypothetical protein